MSNQIQLHYQNYPYPHYPLLASVRRCDTYALNIDALWRRFNFTLPPPGSRKILIAGCGTFAPYPWAIANPDVPVTALDLSPRSLRRARWHCALHGCGNVDFRCGDLSDQFVVEGAFGLIDAFGVLHHLDEPLAGLKTLARRLMPGGIMRIMLYSRYARREEEAIRRAFRILGIDSLSAARRVLRRAAPGSRLARYLAASDEPATVSGLADALLHPQVHTYRIDKLLDMLAEAGLEPLLFAHRDAMPDPVKEVQRLRELEKEKQSPGNFVVYLCRVDRQIGICGSDSFITLNPCLVQSVGRFRPGNLQIPPKLGIDNPPLTYSDKAFLRKFVRPVRRSLLDSSDESRVDFYKRRLILTESIQ